MAYTARERTLNHEDFPILYEDGCLRVYKNPTNEIFVEDLRSHTTIRINQCHHLCGGLQFTVDGRVEPIQVNGMIGWRVSHR